MNEPKSLERLLESARERHLVYDSETPPTQSKLTACNSVLRNSRGTDG